MADAPALTVGRGARARTLLAALRRRVEFADLVALLYLAVFLRQYFWVVADNRLAWWLTALACALLFAAHLRAKEDAGGPTPRVFWAVVALPMLVAYALRLAFPDLSFDALNYHHFLSERSLRGPFFIPGDFFPAIFPFNPSSEMLSGITRVLLGYRLGTVVNYLALLWAGVILERMLRPYVRRAGLRAAGVLLVLFTEHILFEFDTYMVDILTLPLLLEPTRLALRFAAGGEDEERRDGDDVRDGDDARGEDGDVRREQGSGARGRRELDAHGRRELDARDGRDILYAALYVGAAVAFKLTNAAAALPVVAVFVYGLLARRVRPSAKLLRRVALAVVAFAAPLVPYTVYIYAQTGSPVFPVYNKFFRSPYWPPVNIYDGRFGPQGWGETLLWPLLTPLRGPRLSELQVYSGRIAFGVVVAALCVVLPRVDRRARLLSAVFLAGAFLWSATSGNIRYALYLELLCGLLILRLAAWLARNLPPRTLGLTAAALVVCVLLAQNVVAGYYASYIEWGGRQTFLRQRRAYARELRYLTHDHTLRKFLPPDKRRLVESVEVWVVPSAKMSGFEVLLRPDVPMLSVANREYFDAPEARRKFRRALAEAAGKRMYALCLTDDLEPSLAALRERGLVVGQVVPMMFRFYSDHTHVSTHLVEVVAPPAGAAER